MIWSTPLRGLAGINPRSCFGLRWTRGCASMLSLCRAPCCSCPIYSYLCLFYVRSATYSLLLCCARLITPLVEAQRDVHIQLRHVCFTWLLAVGYSFGRHRRVVQQGSRVNFLARGCFVDAPTCFCFVVVTSAQGDIDILLPHICIRLAAFR